MTIKIKILNYLQQYKKASVHEIADYLKLSDISVRRYLAQLEDDNLIKRTHGGAELPITRLGVEYPFESRLLNNLTGKLAIAQKAMDYVQDGDTVAFDLGTSIFKLVEHVVGNRNLIAISSSLKICSMLMDQPGIKLMIPAGEALGAEGAITGILAEQSINRFYYDCFFLGAAGLNNDGTLSDYHLNEILIKQTFMANAKKTILLLDHTKFGQKLSAKITMISSIDILITDKMPTMDMVDMLQKNDVELIVAK